MRPEYSLLLGVLACSPAAGIGPDPEVTGLQHLGEATMGSLRACDRSADAVFSADDSHVLVISDCGVDLLFGGMQRRLDTGSNAVGALSRDGQRVAVALTTGAGRRTAWVGSVKADSMRATLELDEGARVRKMSFAGDGASLIARVSQRGGSESLITFDVATGRAVDSHDSAEGCYASVAASADGTVVMRIVEVKTSEQRSGCLVRDVVGELTLEATHVPSGTILMHRKFGPESQTSPVGLCPEYLEVSPDGRSGLYVDPRHTVRVFDFDANAETSIDNPRQLSRATFTRDGDNVLLWSAGRVELHARRTGRTVWKQTIPLPRKDAFAGRRAAFSQDGSHVLLPVNFRGTAVLDVATGTVLHALDARDSQVVALNQRGDHLLVLARDATRSLRLLPMNGP